MTDYSIAAIPTVYRGRQYRSRLEARWAAFFDALGWKHEYEPYDLHGWVPDFMLHGRCSDGRPRPILCEVKPITEFDLAIGLKMAGALFPGEDSIPPALDLVLLGVAPNFCGAPSIGWNVSFRRVDSIEGNIAFLKAFWIGPRQVRYDFTDEFTPSGDGIITGYFSDPSRVDEMGFRPDLLNVRGTGELVSEALCRLWAEASNEVQWRPVGTAP